MKETYNESVKLADGQMLMTFTVTVTATPALVQDNKFVETCSSTLASAQSLGPNSCYKLSASSKTQQPPSTRAKENQAPSEADKQSPLQPPKAPRLR